MCFECESATTCGMASIMITGMNDNWQLTPTNTETLYNTAFLRQEVSIVTTLLLLLLPAGYLPKASGATAHTARGTVALSTSLRGSVSTAAAARLHSALPPTSCRQLSARSKQSNELSSSSCAAQPPKAPAKQASVPAQVLSLLCGSLPSTCPYRRLHPPDEAAG
jgi:hypothetical protein